jgi:hypothetical protein
VTTVWLTLGAVALVSAAIKAAGPVAVGGRDLPPRALRIIALLGPTLLAALVVVNTLGAERALVVDARLPGVAAAGTALLLRVPLLPAILLAAAVTAGVRALG